jgi:hypothetical protein
MFTVFEFIYIFAFLLWSVTLGLYYALLAVQAFVTLRPIPSQRRATLWSFTAQCLVPLIGFPIFWFCYYVWQPFPDPAEWGSDLNGCMAFYITVGLALALALLTSRLARRGCRHY